MLKETSRKGVVAITQIYNTILRVKHFPIQWKFAAIILIQKPGKLPKEVTSCRPISLLPILSKLFKRLLLNRLKSILTEKRIISQHQFRFRKQHSTIEQVHHIVSVIEESFEKRMVCSAAFIDISQAFDRVWRMGSLYKIKQNLLYCYNLLKSYSTEVFPGKSKWQIFEDLPYTHGRSLR